MYGLPQAGKITKDQLIEFLRPHSYVEDPITSGLWKHKTRDIKFCLVVYNFGVQYTNSTDAKHLLNILQQHYKVSVDWKGEKDLGITLKWDFEKRTCHVSMLGYIERALTRFQHLTPTQKLYSPHKHNMPQYGTKTQYTDDPDNSPAPNAADTKSV